LAVAFVVFIFSLLNKKSKANDELPSAFSFLVVRETTYEKDEEGIDNEEDESQSQSHFVTPKNRWNDSKWKNTKSATPYPLKKIGLFGCVFFLSFITENITFRRKNIFLPGISLIHEVIKFLF